ncbi:phosphocholine cytidylyltransferase family protein [Brumimicrobium oceani]|uniref:Nucleotidyl transferase n=1 Tax=Brumimicrobium oceani TaxID=2100725 RepID=A0A2U2XGS0_9FLAO|nr:phosphocholine cytidylyltransferase family protein [Brumimicrobium oceani]PWH86998.1 nucleotidyl transferase [Brumimicrobium oceani]
MKTRALILAAGRGSRMGAETASKPKCFTLLQGKRLLDWQLEAIRNAGIENISIVTGYKSELFDEGLPTFHNPRWNETNMVGSLFYADDFEGNTLISYSDIVYKSEHIVKLNQAEADITITADSKWESLWNLRFEDPLDDAETFKSDENNQLTEIGQKTDDISNIEAQYMGLIKLTAKGWRKIKEVYESLDQKQKDKMDMTSLLNLLIDRGISVNVVFIDGGWCESDAYSDVLAYEKEIKTNSNWEHYWR